MALSDLVQQTANAVKQTADEVKRALSESERVNAAIMRLSADLVAAQTRLSEAEAAWSRAVTDEVEGMIAEDPDREAKASPVEGSEGHADTPPAEVPSIEELEIRLNVARRDFTRTSDALNVAKARQQAIRMKDEQAAVREKWDRVEELCAARDRDVAELAKSGAVFVNNYQKVVGDTVSIFHALNSIFGAGKIPDSDGALVFTGQGDSIKGLVQRELWRRGLEWNFKLGLVERATTEPLEERFKDASRLIRQWRSRKQV